MTSNDSKSEIKNEINKLTIQVNSPTNSHSPVKKRSSPKKPDRSSRTGLMLRDMPNQTTKDEILQLFTQKSNASKASDDSKVSAGNKEIKMDSVKVTAADVLSVEREFENDWELRFDNEEKCVAAALMLQGTTLHNQIVHCRVDCNATPPETSSKVRSFSQDFHPWGTMDLGNYAENSPIMPNNWNGMNYSPTASSFPDSFLENIRVPDGLFGEATPVAIPVSPYSRVLEMNENQNNIKTPREQKIVDQYHEMIRMKKDNIERTRGYFFPSNMVRSVPKKAVAKALEILSKKEYEIPKEMQRRNGQPRYFAREKADLYVRYGSEEMPLNNPILKKQK